MYRRHRNHFGCIGWYQYVTMLKWKLVLILSKIVPMLMPDRCMVCVERTIDSEIILDAPDGTPR